MSLLIFTATLFAGVVLGVLINPWIADLIDRHYAPKRAELFRRQVLDTPDPGDAINTQKGNNQ